MIAKNFQSNVTISVFASIYIHEITSSGSFSQSAHKGGVAYWPLLPSHLCQTLISQSRVWQIGENSNFYHPNPGL